MGALLTVRNDGPDDADILVGGRYKVTVRNGHQLALSVNQQVVFEPVRPMTPRELAEHTGIPMKDQLEPSRYAEADA